MNLQNGMQSAFDIKKIFMNKWMWLAFCLLMFALPLYKSIHRTLPPEIERKFLIPEFELVDEDGKVFHWSSFRGRFVLVNFHFTRCPSICKDLMASTQEVQKRIRGLGDRVAILSISVDPSYDTSVILNKYSEGLKANKAIWKFVTGTEQQIEQIVIKYFKTPMSKDAIASSSNNIFDIAHSGSFFLIDDEGWFRMAYSSKKENLDKLMIDLGLMVNRKYYR